MIASPYDLDVRYSQKRSVEWRGYKVHVTETCEEDSPNLITNVETTAATDQDVTATGRINDALANKECVQANTWRMELTSPATFSSRAGIGMRSRWLGQCDWTKAGRPWNRMLSIYPSLRLIGRRRRQRARWDRRATSGFLAKGREENRRSRQTSTSACALHVRRGLAVRESVREAHTAREA